MAPIPKPASQRRRRNTAPATTKVPGREGVPAPQPRSSWRPEVAEWYAALSRSPQASVYVESDWATARLACDVLERFYDGGPPSLMSQYARLAASIGVGRADRLRVRVEVSGDDDARPARVYDADHYRARLGVLRDHNGQSPS